MNMVRFGVFFGFYFLCLMIYVRSYSEVFWAMGIS